MNILIVLVSKWNKYDLFWSRVTISNIFHTVLEIFLFPGKLLPTLCQGQHFFLGLQISTKKKLRPTQNFGLKEEKQGDFTSIFCQKIDKLHKFTPGLVNFPDRRKIWVILEFEWVWVGQGGGVCLKMVVILENLVGGKLYPEKKQMLAQVCC